MTWPLKTSPVTSLPKYTTVFGVPVFSVGSTTEAQFQHAASVLAELLDNDGDGCVDNPTVLTKLTEKTDVDKLLVQASIVMPGKGGSWEKEDALTQSLFNAGYWAGRQGYGYYNALLNDEYLLPSCSGPTATSSCADASLEKIWHVITTQGYAKAFPWIFDASRLSELASASDAARSEEGTPWYTNNDATCNYECKTNKYFYWGIAAWVGALVGRGDAIKNEWKFETKAKLEAGDLKMTAIIKVFVVLFQTEIISQLSPGHFHL